MQGLWFGGSTDLSESKLSNSFLSSSRPLPETRPSASSCAREGERGRWKGMEGDGRRWKLLTCATADGVGGGGVLTSKPCSLAESTAATTSASAASARRRAASESHCEAVASARPEYSVLSATIRPSSASGRCGGECLRAGVLPTALPLIWSNEGSKVGT